MGLKLVCVTDFVNSQLTTSVVCGLIKLLIPSWKYNRSVHTYMCGCVSVCLCACANNHLENFREKFWQICRFVPDEHKIAQADSLTSEQPFSSHSHPFVYLFFSFLISFGFAARLTIFIVFIFGEVTFSMEKMLKLLRSLNILIPRVVLEFLSM